MCPFGLEDSCHDAQKNITAFFSTGVDGSEVISWIAIRIRIYDFFEASCYFCSVKMCLLLVMVVCFSPFPSLLSYSTPCLGLEMGLACPCGCGE
mmetsp:Transcript_45325/g.54984  ORF Transcript_45325/g.54984 Transcript_45325/m.54984 type:complete len:94 (-) Transcript_45325:4-285(-)